MIARLIESLRQPSFANMKLMQRLVALSCQCDFADRWHSFDATPWRYPWLTDLNLRAMKVFSVDVREQARRFSARIERGQEKQFAFVCNMANSMYTTADALKSLGFNADIYPHPDDGYLMSQPEWEDFDGVVDEKNLTLIGAMEAGCKFPPVSRVYRIPKSGAWTFRSDMPEFVGYFEYYRWRNYYSQWPLLRELHNYDALFAIQSPYLAYLTGKPYMATHMGGDIWFECSRDDMLGKLQRTAFRKAQLVIASNPWSYAFARRYGMRNMVYLPTLLNPEKYSPGAPDFREEWRAKTGGSFFVLSTARVDDLFKGSKIALEGFKKFSLENPSARLILTGWGADIKRHMARIEEFGLADLVEFVPPAGKTRLIRYLRSAHCLLDQFVLGYYGMTALEAMAVGVPTIMKIQSHQYEAFSDGGCPPVLNAGNSDEVCSALNRLISAESYRMSVANQSREWFLRYSGQKEWQEDYVNILYALASGVRFDFTSSPLAAPLLTDEKAYLAEQLRSAPSFPNYS